MDPLEIVKMLLLQGEQSSNQIPDWICQGLIEQKYCTKKTLKRFLTELKTQLSLYPNESPNSKTSLISFYQSEVNSTENEIKENTPSSPPISNQTPLDFKNFKNSYLESEAPDPTVKIDSVLQQEIQKLITDERRYEILETLGEGGMGVVQRVQDQLLGREVALKKIKSHSDGDFSLNRKEQIRLWRLRNEAFITAILEHPNIVPLYDLERKINGELYFTMRKVEGNTLGQILKMKAEGVTKYSSDQLMMIFLKICDAVAYAHSRNIIHRDLKPDNIMVGQFGEVYVMDWGLAKDLNAIPITPSEKHLQTLSIGLSATNSPKEEKQASSKSFSSDIEKIKEETIIVDDLSNDKNQGSLNDALKTIGGVGTPGYMPPEQREDASKVDEGSDIYALGKILKQCFTYMSPLDEFKKILKKHEEKRPHLLPTTNDSANELKKNLAFWSKKKKRSKLPHQEIKVEDILKPELPKDIAAIVKKATEEKRILRYDAVSEIAKDIELYLKNYQISAREYHVLELLLKWSRRHQKTIRIVCLSIVVVLCSLFTFQWLRYQKNLKTDQKNLNRWLQVLTDPKPGDRELALLEVSKMRQKEISRQLIREFNKGSNYFLSSKNPSPKQDGYFQIITKMIGNLENPATTTPLLNSLFKMTQKLRQIPPRARRFEEINYMVAITEALKDSKVSKVSHHIFNAQKEMGWNSLYSKKTKEAYIRLGLLDTLETPDIKDATSYYDLGNLKHHIGDFQGSLEAFNEAIRLKPDYTAAYNNRGINFLSLEKYQKALDDFVKVLQLYPDAYDISNNLGMATYFLKDYDRAIHYFTLHLERYPNDSAPHANRGLAKSGISDFDGALKDFNEALRLNPRNLDAYRSRGELKRILKKYEWAIEDFNAAIRLAPKDFVSLTNRALVEIELKKYEEALQDLNEVISLSPRNSEAFNYRGVIKMEKEDFQGSLADYNEALRLNPKYIWAYNNRGLLFLRIKKFDLAIQDFNRVLEQEKDADVYLNLGLAYFRSGNLEKALLHFNHALKVDPTESKIYEHCASIKMRQGKLQEALKDCNKAIKLDPLNSNAFNARANIKLKYQNFKGAIEDLNTAIELNPKNLKSYGERANAKSELKDFDGAIADYNQVLNLDPQDVFAYNNRGEVKFTKRDFVGALKDYNEAIRLDPEYPGAYNSRGVLKMMQNDLAGAVKDYSKTIKFAKKRMKTLHRGEVKRYKQLIAYTHFNLASCFLKQNQVNQAIEAMKEGLLFQKESTAQQKLAELFLNRMLHKFRKKQFLQAKEDLLNFQEYAPLNHPKRKQIPYMMKRIEENIKE